MCFCFLYIYLSYIYIVVSCFCNILFPSVPSVVPRSSVKSRAPKQILFCSPPACYYYPAPT